MNISRSAIGSSPIPAVGLLILMAAAFGACTTESMYYAAQQWQKNECNRVLDADERARCARSTATSYDAYKAERDSTRPKQ